MFNFVAKTVMLILVTFALCLDSCLTLLPAIDWSGGREGVKGVLVILAGIQLVKVSFAAVLTVYFFRALNEGEQRKRPVKAGSSELSCL